jgi:KUP system potassium uptake protein
MSSEMSIEQEERHVEYEKKHVKGWPLAVLSLASLGIVFGDIGTSPLYVMTAVLGDKNERPSDQYLLGVFSTIFWTITLMVLVKYVWITLGVDDHGEGGVFALHSIVRRAVSSKPSDFGVVSEDGDIPSKTKEFLKKSKFVRRLILFVVIACAALTMSDGVLTPAISVISATEGIQFHTGISHAAVIWITVGILTALFSIQFVGTSKVGVVFGPVMFAWFAFNFATGVYNVTKMPGVFKALSPHYMYYFWSEFGAWSAFKSLGSIFLAITGVEALYADMGHLNASSIRLSFTCLVYPSLVMTYLGQTVVIIEDYTTSTSVYWSSVPEKLIWTSVVIATLAAIIASQALITGTFTVVRQAMHANVFPRIVVRQTNAKHEGQIFIPFVNFTLFLGSIAVIFIFGNSTKIAHAYGFAVAVVIFLTHILFCVVLSLLGKNHAFTFVFSVFFGIISACFLASTSIKIPDGAWFSIAIGSFISFVCIVWHRGHRMKIRHIKNNRLSAREVFSGVPNVSKNIIFYNELSDGIVPAYKQLESTVQISGINNIVLCVRKMSIPRVPEDQRLLLTGHDGIYHIIARYGYAETIDHGANFARDLCSAIGADSSDVVFIVGKTRLTASKRSSIVKKMTVFFYSTLAMISSWTTDTFKTPRDKLLIFEAAYAV